MADNKGLTPKQQAFCEYYLQSFNATESYKKAYTNIKSDDVAAAASSRMLRNVKIKDYIEKVNKMAQNKRILTLEQIKEMYSDIAGDKNNDLRDRITALDKLSRYVGISSSEELKYKNEAKRLELEEKKLELLLAKEQVKEDADSGVVMIPSIDLDSYEKEKEDFLKGLDSNG